MAIAPAAQRALAWADREGLAKSNPAAQVEIGVSGERSTILEDAADYGRLFETLDRMEDERRIRPAAADAIRLIALDRSAARRSHRSAVGAMWT